ncbi:MAPEG family protein [Sphingomonas profundi]|uniref:MAPEG family protein n=1 Tax=Alterirhizorhabdus profundi TaxID=2681549 RepID=UPI0012E726FB|nr:MAPEG family protein [Sphingomonas profundi]
MAMRSFRREQRGVAVAMAIALGITIVALGLAATLDRGAAQVPFALRLRSALRADLLVIGWLAATIANVARLRFLSERDIAGSAGEAGSDEVRRAGAILQNTLEQVVPAVCAHMIVAATFARPEPLVWTMAGLFAIGRLLFWAGYRRGATGRALGFGLTFYPSVAGLIAAAAVMLAG